MYTHTLSHIPNHRYIHTVHKKILSHPILYSLVYLQTCKKKILEMGEFINTEEKEKNNIM